MSKFTSNLTELELKIQDAAQRYYNDGSSPLTDDEFDALVAQLKQTNPYSVLFTTGWGYDVNADSTPGEKVPHKYGLIGSLDKCRTLEEIGQDYIDSRVYASLKLDGMSVVLYYQIGNLVQALTRGDGTMGIDITDKISIIDPTLLHINDKQFTGAVRGEIVMSDLAFRAYQKIEPEAKNSRNTTVGLIGKSELSDNLEYLDIVVYSIVADERYPNTFRHMNEVYDFLEENFESVVKHSPIALKPMMNMWKYRLEGLRDDWYGVYPADGIVLNQPLIRLNDEGYFAYTGKAFKFPAESKQTSVVNVKWRMSKLNVLVPVVEILPTELSGATVTFVTGYHASYIEESGIGPGAVIEVTRSGEVIPKIISVVEPVRATLPTTCPICGTALSKGVTLRCTNPDCSNQTIQDTLNWLKMLCPTDGLGDTLILKYLRELYANPSIESVMSAPSAVLNLPGQGQSGLMLNMLSRLYDTTTKFTLSQALQALNIPRVGEVTADKLSSHSALIQKTLTQDQLYYDDIAALSSIVGQATVNTIQDNFDKWLRLNLIINKVDWNVNQITTTSSLGKVAITGKLSIKRADFERQLRSAGYTVGDITKDTKFLITDDPNSSSSKNKKADQLGITKITEQEFRFRYLGE